MLDWQFILNPDTDALEVDEPVGWADTDIKIIRDPKFHGISVAFGTRSLQFVGEGGELIQAAYELAGAEAETILRVSLLCDDVVQYTEDFSLDYNQYQQLCGDRCAVSIGFEQKSCFRLVNSNIQKAVDADKLLAFDGVTALTEYDWMQREIEIPAVGIAAEDRAEIGNDEDLSLDVTADFDWDCAGCINDTWFGYFLPGLPVIKNSSLGTFNPSAFPQLIRYYGANNHPPYEVDMTVNTESLLEDLQCAFGDTEASFRLKGRVQIAVTGGGSPGILLRTKIFRLPAGLDETNPNNWVEEYSQNLVDTTAGGSGTYEFDQSATVPITLNEGDLVHFGFFLNVVRFSQITSFVFTQDKNEPGDITNFFELKTVTLCDPSNAKVYGLYELLSRLTESISNKCLSVESNYYGRTDSQPEAYDEDGCGSLRVITSGLYLRNAEKPAMSMTLYELLESLQCIDNIGFDLYKDSTDADRLRIEPVVQFYQTDSEILRCPFVNRVERKVATGDSIGTIASGYQKWQPLNINGLDEINATREHRLKLNNSNTKLTIASKLVASGSAIETTRQQSFAASGGADTTYDNDNFIICMERDGYDMVVEQGGILDAGELIDPATVLNFRISPLRNLMRWFKSIIGSYRVVDPTTTEIEFVAGTGNFSAEGYRDDACAVEAVPASPYVDVPAENMNINADAIKSDEDKTPLFRPESDTFDYPMSLNDFLTIRANPYGYISYQCGTGAWRKGFIRTITYRLSSNTATFELRTVYE